jgi:hypothetical protein
MVIFQFCCILVSTFAFDGDFASERDMFKRVLRRIAATLKRWLDEDTANSASRADDADWYTLNPDYRKLMADSRHRHLYTWGVMHALHLAKVLEIPRVSVLEFGVAGGNGLLALEAICEEVTKLYGVEADIIGFDSGKGLPKPEDYRDLPNLWSEGYYHMDEAKLRSRLKRARLFLGWVDGTVSEFSKSNPAPVAFVSFDMDYYTSTKQALRLFDATPALLLPRIHCVFDDICAWTFGDHNGERLAISEFNEEHKMRKISKMHGLRYYVPFAFSDGNRWEKYYMAHIFEHPLYGQNDGLIQRESSERTLSLR